MPACVVLLLVAAISLLAQNASVEGIVVNVADGQPLSGVHVRLTQLSSGGVGELYGAISTPTGHFSMASVRPGGYMVTYDRTGFAPVHGDSEPRQRESLTLKAGQRLTGWKLEMAPQAALSGRVFDNYGDPMSMAQVRLEPVDDGRVRGNSGTNATQTDDHGEFRLSGPPGRYHLYASASGRSGVAGGPSEIRTDGTTPVVYATTYYPAAVSRDDATVIETKAGEDRAGLEIRMVPRSNLSISGEISGIPADTHARAMVTLMFKRERQQLKSSVGGGADAMGRFSFSGLEPGAYTMIAQWTDGKTRLQSGTQNVRLDGASITGVALALGPPAEIHGVFTIAGAKPGDPTKRTVAFTPIDFPIYAFHLDPAAIEKDGAFHSIGAAPARYTIDVSPLPENAYIKTLVVNGTDVAKNGKNEIDLTSGVHSSTLKIVASLNGGEITGAIRDKDGSVMTGVPVAVYLASGPLEHPTLTTARSRENGTFALHGVRPGKYRLFAIDFTRNLNLRGEDAIGKFAARTEEFDVAEGARLTRNLTPLSDVTSENNHANPSR